LGQNPIGADGAAALLDAIHTHNNTTALTLLDIMVSGKQYDLKVNNCRALYIIL